MIPYGYIVFSVTRQIGRLLEDGQISQKTKNFLGSRTSALKSSWRCLRMKCDYYQVYQAYGPADLTHVGYHAAEKLALEHLGKCDRRPCEVCGQWATRLRGELWQAIMSGPDKEKIGFH